MPEKAAAFANSGGPCFFQVANPDDVGIKPAPLRLDDSLTTWARTISSFQKELLVASARTGKVWRLVCDEGDYMNSGDTAPCSLAFFTAGMLASYMNEIMALAEEAGVRINKIRLTQDNYYTMEGSMPKRTMVGGALPVELHAEIDGEASRDKLTALVYQAIAAAPVNGLIRGKLDNLFALALNGRELKPCKAHPLGRPIHPDPGDRFALAKPLPSDKSIELIRQGEPTPKMEGEGLTAAPGAGLEDQQSRLVRIGGACTLRDDGLKDITQLQYSPHGLSYHFVSEEAPAKGGEGNGGKGRAPDANTLISAGLACCFLTQFTRFADILDKKFDAVRIIQDTHFSLGGASGKTGVAGKADPVETHVYLQTDEGEDVAKDSLDMSEQTCYMQALCRTDMKIRINVSS